MACVHTVELYHLPKNVVTAPQTISAQLCSGIVWKKWGWQHKTTLKPSSIWTQVFLCSSGAPQGRKWTLSGKNPLLLWLWSSRLLSSASLGSCCSRTIFAWKIQGSSEKRYLWHFRKLGALRYWKHDDHSFVLAWNSTGKPPKQRN